MCDNDQIIQILNLLETSPAQAKTKLISNLDNISIKILGERWEKLRTVEKYFFLKNFSQNMILDLTKYIDINNERIDIRDFINEKADLSEKREFLRYSQLELEAIYSAIKELENCESKDKDNSPLVSAVLIDDNDILLKAYRGELNPGDHAEYTLVSKAEEKGIELQGKTLITTLEPCTKRGVEKTPCSEHIVKNAIKKVIIGMIDPNDDIRGKGILFLRQNNIHIEYFPHDLAVKVEEKNEKFISDQMKSYKIDLMSSKRLKHNTLELSSGICDNNDIQIHLNSFLMEFLDPVDLYTLCINMQLNWGNIRKDIVLS